MPSITGAHEAGRHNFQQRLALWLAAEAPQRRGCLCRIAPVALRRKLNSDKVCGWNAVNSLRRVVMLEQNVLLGRKCVPHSLLFRKCLQVGYGEGQLIVCNELLKHTLCVVNILMQHLPQASHGMLSAEWGLPGEVCTVPRRVSTQAVRIRFRLTFLHFTGKNPLQAWGLKILIELSLWESLDGVPQSVHAVKGHHGMAAGNHRRAVSNPGMKLSLLPTLPHFEIDICLP
mmetsp:Transcript_98910/g.235956  ORF Transcript_98910/g.235956 Transcript_98910/m.235956 type:complete len:230 (+) Transcript_98910:1718-2407(+)